MLEDYDIAIMSPAYPIFEVIDENVVMPEYLDMWFKRSEFDREAVFIAVGGVRPIEKQRGIVASYKAITDRIALKQKINDNLAA